MTKYSSFGTSQLKKPQFLLYIKIIKLFFGSFCVFKYVVPLPRHSQWQMPKKHSLHLSVFYKPVFGFVLSKVSGPQNSTFSVCDAFMLYEPTNMSLINWPEMFKENSEEERMTEGRTNGSISDPTSCEAVSWTSTSVSC